MAGSDEGTSFFTLVLLTLLMFSPRKAMAPARGGDAYLDSDLGECWRGPFRISLTNE